MAEYNTEYEAQDLYAGGFRLLADGRWIFLNWAPEGLVGRILPRESRLVTQYLAFSRWIERVDLTRIAVTLILPAIIALNMGWLPGPDAPNALVAALFTSILLLFILGLALHWIRTRTVRARTRDKEQFDLSPYITLSGIQAGWIKDNPFAHLCMIATLYGTLLLLSHKTGLFPLWLQVYAPPMERFGYLLMGVGATLVTILLLLPNTLESAANIADDAFSDNAFLKAAQACSPLRDFIQAHRGLITAIPLIIVGMIVIREQIDEKPVTKPPETAAVLTHFDATALRERVKAKQSPRPPIKWRGDVRVAIHGPGGGGIETLSWLAGFLDDLGRITGLRFELLPQEEASADIFIRFKDPKNLKKWVPKNLAVTKYGHENGWMERGEIIVNANLIAAAESASNGKFHPTEQVISRGLLKTLGLKAPPSPQTPTHETVLGKSPEATPLDFAALKLLYDPHILPGMSPEEARETARRLAPPASPPINK